MDAIRSVFFIEENSELRQAIQELLCQNGFRVRSFKDEASFLNNFQNAINSCVLIDSTTSKVSSSEFVRLLSEKCNTLPVIIITRDEANAIASEAGLRILVEFVSKPVCCNDLVDAIRRALKIHIDPNQIKPPRLAAKLTTRQAQILDLILAGHSNKSAASQLGLSQRTVEEHRAALMAKFGAENISSLVRTALCSRCPRKTEAAKDD